MRKVFAYALLFALTPVIAFAHGTGAFYQTTVGEYIVDVGYSSPAPVVGESVILDFQLRTIESKLTSGTDADFEDVWVKVESEKEKTIVFATGIHNAEFGGPRMSYVFPHEGTYTISARYETKDGSLAEASFPMTVLPASSQGGFPASTQSLLFLVAGLVAGASGAYFAGRSALRKMPSTGA